MARQWDKDLARRYDEFRQTDRAWELLHEEEGFEDGDDFGDHMISDLDGAETHMHFLIEEPKKMMQH